MESRPDSEDLLFGTMTRFLHTVAQAAAIELETFDLTPAQYQLLVSIRTQPGIAQWQLADAFGVTRGNVSQLIKKLEAAGHISRDRNQGADELALTAAGTELLGRVIPAHRSFMKRTFATLSADDRSTLQALLERLTTP